MPPFEKAPAELFLAKRTKSSHDNDRRFATAAEAIRYTVEDLRTPRVLRRLASGSVMSASTASKSNGCTTVGIRCGNQRVTKRRRRCRMGSLYSQSSGFRPPDPRLPKSR